VPRAGIVIFYPADGRGPMNARTASTGRTRRDADAQLQASRELLRIRARRIPAGYPTQPRVSINPPNPIMRAVILNAATQPAEQAMILGALDMSANNASALRTRGTRVQSDLHLNA
jgi:hypothetical protein